MMRLILAITLGLLPVAAMAGPVVLSWDPATAPPATGYEIEQSIDAMVTWTKVADLTVAAACTGTPVICATTVTAPATGVVFYRFIAKNAVGRSTRFVDGIWHCESCSPPGSIPNVGVR